eukprot:g4458.t1
MSEKKKAKTSTSTSTSSSSSSSSSPPYVSAPTLTDVALGWPGVFENILTTCGDAKTLSRLDRVSKLFHAPTQKVSLKEDEKLLLFGSNMRVQIHAEISLVERALRRMSEQAGRGIRGAALPPTVAGPPLPNWTQVLLRELRRGFWRKVNAPMQGDGDGKLDGGSDYSLFLTEDGKAYSCGTGGAGKLGHGNQETQHVPKLIEALSGVRVCAVSAGDHHSLFLTEGGKVYSCGSGGSGQLGHGNEEDQYVPKLIEALSGVRVCAVSAGGWYSLFLTEDGKAYSCGYGNCGKLGHGNEDNQHVPKLIEALSGVRVCAVSAGGEHSLFLTEDGKAYSCGHGSMLGHGNTEDQDVPKLIEALGGVRMCAVSAGDYHSLFLTEDGKAYSCGRGVADDDTGMLGHGDGDDRLVPKLIEALSGMRVCAVSAGWSHSLFLTEGGKAYSCGSSTFGKLGHGNQQNQDVPKHIEALRGVRVCAASASSYNHSLFSAEDGSAHSCGGEDGGVLGHGDEEHQDVPKRIDALPAV